MNVFDRLANSAISSNVCKEEDKAMLVYSFRNLSFSLLTWLTFIVLGIFVGKTSYCIVFIVLFLPLRMYSGGFHQNSRSKCYITSIFIFTLVLCVSYIPISNAVYMLLLLTSGIIIFLLAPVPDNNKPLNSTEFLAYKKVARILLVIETLISITLRYVFFIEKFSHSSLVSIVTVSLLLVLGKAKNVQKK